MSSFTDADRGGAAPPDDEAPAPVKGTGTGAGCRSAEDGPDDTPSGREAETASKPGFIGSPADLPAFKAYMDRVGAVPRGMFTAVVQEFVGRYPQAIAEITLDRVDGKPTGEITVKAMPGVDPTPYLPTEGEREAIRPAVKVALWPEHRPCATIRNAPPALAAVTPEDLFEFRDGDGNIIMLQERRETKDGGKAYIPWTPWSDGPWRSIEPPGLLPLWGIDQLAGADTVFLHEGAKAARAMRRMCEAQTPDMKRMLAEHPWGRDLQHAAHLGWIGGALAPHRTDWSVLQTTGIKKVYIPADNDAGGESAVAKISRATRSYGTTNTRVSFAGSYNGATFPTSFDLGDPFPDAMFKSDGDADGDGDGGRRYVGPSMRECTEPATWATRPGPPPPKTGKPGAPVKAKWLLNAAFLRQWYMVIFEGQVAFVPEYDRTRMYVETTFNARAQQYSDDPRTSDLLKAHDDTMRCFGVAYEPGTASAVVNIDGRRCVNTYEPSIISLRTGDPAQWKQWSKEWSLWVEFLHHLIPDPKDCHELMRWIATLISRPDIRMKYALLLASKMQGVGKTTLFEILRVILGKHNCSAPSAKDMFESSFNEWLAGKRLICVNEVYEGGNRRAYNKLKSIVSDKSIEVNRKHLPTYTITNWSHYIFCSNDMNALSIDEDDRRILAPTITGKKWRIVNPVTKQLLTSPETWERFYNWLDGGGYQLIVQWADDFLRSAKPVGPGDDAPMTSRKREMIEDSRSSEEQLVLGLADAALERSAVEGRPVALAEGDVVAWLLHRAQAEQRRVAPVKTSDVIRWLVAAGLFASDWLTIDGRKQKVALTGQINGRKWSDLRGFRTAPDNLSGGSDEPM